MQLVHKAQHGHRRGAKHNALEYRTDAADGKAYSARAFVEEYGGSIKRLPMQWRTAPSCGAGWVCPLCMVGNPPTSDICGECHSVPASKARRRKQPAAGRVSGRANASGGHGHGSPSSRQRAQQQGLRASGTTRKALVLGLDEHAKAMAEAQVRQNAAKQQAGLQTQLKKAAAKKKQAEGLEAAKQRIAAKLKAADA